MTLRNPYNKVVINGESKLTQSFVTQYVKDKIDNWVNNVIALSHIATTQPHAAYFAFTHGLVHKWSYLARKVPDITRLFQPLEDVIHTKFIPCLTGRAPPNDLERNLLLLPPRLGGLGIPNPTLQLIPNTQPQN